MPQFNLSKKLVSTVQLWASLLLIVLAFVFSVTPIITLKNVENADKIIEMMEDLDLDSDVMMYIEEETEISSPKLISSIALIYKMIVAANAEGEDQAEKAAELREFLDTEEGKKSVATALSLTVAIVKTLDFKNSSDVISFILNIFVSVIGLLAVLLMTLAMPFIFGILALISLIKALKNIKNPEKAAPALAKKLPGLMSLPLILMLFQCVVRGMSYGSGLVAICIIAIISTVINFAASRARKYPNDQFIYLNIVQGCSLVGVVGFLVFFFNIIRTGIFKAFISGKYASYLASVLAAKDAGADTNWTYIIDGVLILVYMIIVLGASGYLEKSARRFSCASKKERATRFSTAKIKDNYIVGAIFTLAAFIIPTVLSNLKHGYNDVTSTASTGDFSFIELTDAQKEYLTAALIGIIIMIIAEVAIIVLKKVFCANMSKEDADALISGNAKPFEEISEASESEATAATTVAGSDNKSE